MTVLDFINHLLGREKPSGTMARERLQLVLAHDRSDLNPELLEQMRREILEVVQRYVEIDIESCDVSLETEDRVTALLANLPIKRTREFPPPPIQARTGGVDGQAPVAGASTADSTSGGIDGSTCTAGSAAVAASASFTGPGTSPGLSES